MMQKEESDSIIKKFKEVQNTQEILKEMAIGYIIYRFCI